MSVIGLIRTGEGCALRHLIRYVRPPAAKARHTIAPIKAVGHGGHQQVVATEILALTAMRAHQDHVAESFITVLQPLAVVLLAMVQVDVLVHIRQFHAKQQAVQQVQQEQHALDIAMVQEHATPAHQHVQKLLVQMD